MGLNDFVTGHLNILVIVSVILAVISVCAALFLLFELKRLRKPFSDMADFYKDTGAEKALEKLLKGVDENREYLRGHSEEIRMILGELDKCYRGMGIVKYNAFEDIGGMQSYSLCLLTLEKNGILLTNLVGRNSTRGYALEIKDGNPSRELSGEEKEALAYSLKSLDSCCCKR